MSKAGLQGRNGTQFAKLINIHFHSYQLATCASAYIPLQTTAIQSTGEECAVHCWCTQYRTAHKLKPMYNKPSRTIYLQNKLLTTGLLYPLNNQLRTNRNYNN